MSQSLPTAVQASGPQALIVEDHTIVAQALSNLLKLSFGLQTTIISTSAEAHAVLQDQRFAFALLDLELADGHGLSVAETLSREQPDCALIVVSGQVDHLYCPAELRRKLTAVISKAQAFDELNAVVSTVLKQRGGDASTRRLNTLTAREADVYRLMGTGRSCKQIATDLGLTVRTVETHRKHIASKIGVSGAELVHRATLDNLRLDLEPGAEANQP